MNYSESCPENYQIVTVDNYDRWQVYNRLQSLELPCFCQSHQPLRIELRSPLVAIQVWSVIKQTKSPRQYLVNWLENCWAYSSVAQQLNH